MKKKVVRVICTLMVLGTITLETPMSFVHNMIGATVVKAEEIEARAYIYEWFYKVIDGHLYKRLYNATKEEWVGDWILIE